MAEGGSGGGGGGGGGGGDGKKSGGYAVGYGKPPAHSRFRPGHSGNPRGKAKGAKNLSTLFREELDQSIAVTSNGKRRKVQTARVIVKQLINQAAAGDLKATNMVLEQARRLNEADARSESAAFDTFEDALTMESILKRFRAVAPGADDPTATAAMSVGDPATRKDPTMPEPDAGEAGPPVSDETGQGEEGVREAAPGKLAHPKSGKGEERS